VKVCGSQLRADLTRMGDRPVTPGEHRIVVPTVTPQLVAGSGVLALRAAIADPDRYVVEPKVAPPSWPASTVDGGRGTSARSG